MFHSDKQVAERYHVTRECVWKWARTLPDFPKPVLLSPGCTRWVDTELIAYELAKIAEREEVAA